jgi:hypothetical protein
MAQESALGSRKPTNWSGQSPSQVGLGWHPEGATRPSRAALRCCLRPLLLGCCQSLPRPTYSDCLGLGGETKITLGKTEAHTTTKMPYHLKSIRAIFKTLLQQGCQDRTFNMKRTVFSTNGTEKAGYPHTKERILTLTFCQIQKLVLNGSET